MTLVEFLRARLAEDERDAREIQALIDSGAEDVSYYSPARVLAEVDAKRRIVDECAYWMDKVEAGDDYPALADRFEVVMSVLRLLALPYADHADHREEWKP